MEDRLREAKGGGEAKRQSKCNPTLGKGVQQVRQTLGVRLVGQGGVVPPIPPMGGIGGCI